MRWAFDNLLVTWTIIVDYPGWLEVCLGNLLDQALNSSFMGAY